MRDNTKDRTLHDKTDIESKYDGFVKPGDKDPKMQKIIEDAFDRIFGNLLKKKG